eukprot:2055940-Pleurochrysis_carterae.AAC.2
MHLDAEAQIEERLASLCVVIGNSRDGGRVHTGARRTDGDSTASIGRQLLVQAIACRLARVAGGRHRRHECDASGGEDDDDDDDDNDDDDDSDGKSDDDDDELWRQAEQEEVLERAEALWARKGADWEAAFEDFGTRVPDCGQIFERVNKAACSGTKQC